MPEGIIKIPKAPDYIQFYPTLRCNMTCSFCFNRGFADAAGIKDAAMIDFEEIVALAAKQGIGHIDFLGGEPTLHPHIADMIRIIESAGLMASLSSNGTRVAILETLSRRFSEASLRIGISVNGGSPGKDLVDYIHHYKPIVKTLFSGPQNIFEVPPFAAIDATGIALRLIYRDAVNEADLAQCAPYPEYYRSLGQLKSTMQNLEGVYCGGFLPDADHSILHGARCPAGTTKLAVLPNGDVYPCYLLFRYTRFRLGNLLKDDFRSIWENPLLDAFRYFEKNRCPETGCELIDRCHGGCPATSYILNGDLAGPDPRCRGVGR